MMRIEKYIANSGLYSRNDVKKLIRAKRILVNEELVNKAGTMIDEFHDQVFIDGELLQYAHELYIMLNKPQDVVSATQDNLYPTVLDVIDDILPKDCFPVGRLDVDTEGLLLISNDGTLAHRLLSPRHHVSKVYEVTVKHDLNELEMKRIEAGMMIDQEEQCLPAKIKRVDECMYHLTIEEGKYHQVKRMMLAVGNEVVYLKRIQMGQLTLDENLDTGEWRYLRDEEIAALKAL